MNLFARKFNTVPGGKLLDVATGGGGFIRILIESFAGYKEIIGIDICDDNFEEARKRFNNDRVSFVEMDGACLQFDNESFDGVSMCTGLHHLSDIKAVLSEMKRVLKTGGYFILREQFCDNQTKKQLSDIACHHWRARLDRLRGKTHNPTLKKSEIIGCVNSLDMKSVEAEEYLCRECDPEKEGKMTETMADMEKELTELTDHPEHKDLKKEVELIHQRIRQVGYACATHLDIVAIK